MPSSITWGVLLLAGLCCLLHDSQAKRPKTTDAFGHDHEHREKLPCNNMSYNVIDLAFALYRDPDRWSKNGNVLFSPVSIAAALAMLSMGTKGETHTQILKGLKLNLKEVPEGKIHECFQHLFHVFQQPNQRLRLTTGSSLFIKSDLKPTEKFVRNAKNFYHSLVIPVDFHNTKDALIKINSHVEQESKKKINGLVKNLQKNTALALVNYIFFQGIWNEEFEAERNLIEDFHVNKWTTIKVPMINRLGNFFLHWDKRLSSWVLVQHHVGDATAFVILPELGKMKEVEKKLSHSHFEDILRTIDMRPVNLYFPKLSISGTYDLKKVLGRLGITRVFTNEAGLSGVTEAGPLRLSKALHKAVLTFDKKGTENSGVDKWNQPAWAKVPTLKFNRPFLLIIKDEYTNFPLFCGKVMNPIQK